jgi:hypothetical protein
VLFVSLLLLVSSIQYFIASSLPSNAVIKAHGLYLARWTISGSSSASFVFMTGMALLNHSLDDPGTLLVDNCYFRMAPRAVVCIVVMCLSLIAQLSAWLYLSILVCLLQILILWEFIAAMDKGFMFIEPKDSDNT